MIVACYSVDLYCENYGVAAIHGYMRSPGQYQGETWGECVKQARADGWVISRDRQACWCPRCAKTCRRAKRAQ